MSTPVAAAALAGFEVVLPNGKTIKAHSPTLADAARFLVLVDQENQTEALTQLATDFPPAVGCTADDFADLSLAEFRDTVVAFLGLRRAKPTFPGLTMPPTPAPST